MMSLARLAILVAGVVALQCTSAFQAPLPRSVAATRNSHVVSTSMLLAQRDDSNDSNDGTNQVDYGKVLGMLFNPVNPYAWFLYFFIGIFAVFRGGSIVSGGSAVRCDVVQLDAEKRCGWSTDASAAPSRDLAAVIAEVRAMQRKGMSGGMIQLQRKQKEICP
eukprot:CAMPEP_0198134902 /NCGR_PEP_ID=MMETSP1442-20131203/60314_1 /TAXON_ID= /ORGANISM="Craspedostauros australis, Strain CCMP3328" /LENGTH=162 /DNA_ID=CAMNT_0043796059 /DNA_START=210 /DNA_END=698 /DNA_ORIENTATION=-